MNVVLFARANVNLFGAIAARESVLADAESKESECSVSQSKDGKIRQLSALGSRRIVLFDLINRLDCALVWFRLSKRRLSHNHDTIDSSRVLTISLDRSQTLCIPEYLRERKCRRACSRRVDMLPMKARRARKRARVKEPWSSLAAVSSVLWGAECVDNKRRASTSEEPLTSHHSRTVVHRMSEHLDFPDGPRLTAFYKWTHVNMSLRTNLTNQLVGFAI